MDCRVALMVIVGYSLSPSSSGFSDKEPISLCEVASHLDEYMNKTLVIRGVVVFYEHGAYLDAPTGCNSGLGLEDIDLESYRWAGGRKGAGVLATVKGKIVKSKYPRVKGPVFSVSSVRYDKPPRKSK
jgi:hypothetical protein